MTLRLFDFVNAYKMKRLFLAIPIKTTDNDFIPLLDGLKRQLAHEKRINWVKPHNIHLTLKFIGDTPNEDIPKIIDAVDEMLKNHKSFIMDFNRTGIFGSRYAPRVLWLGFNDTPQELYDLEDDTLSTFDKLGYLRDRQNFVPHITLGRIKELCEKQYFQKIVSGIEQKSYIKQEVNEIILFQSMLRPEGAVYREIKKYSI